MKLNRCSAVGLAGNSGAQWASNRGVSVTTTELSQEMSSFSFNGAEFYPQEMLTPIPRQVRGRTWCFLYFWFKSTLRSFQIYQGGPRPRMIHLDSHFIPWFLPSYFTADSGGSILYAISERQLFGTKLIRTLNVSSL